MRKALIFSSFLLMSPLVFADALDDSAQKTNEIAAKQDSAQVSDALAGNYTQLAGTKDNANALVAGLRTGQSITLTSKSGVSTTIDGSGKSMGWGGVNNTLALVQASLQKANITNPTSSELALAVSSITSLRSSGMGWGEIAKSMGLNLGSVVSNSRASEKALSHRSSHSEVEHGLEAEHKQGELHKSGTVTEHAGKSDDSAGRSSGQKGDDGAKGGSSSASSGSSGKGSGGSSGSSGSGSSGSGSSGSGSSGSGSSGSGSSGSGSSGSGSSGSGGSGGGGDGGGKGGGSGKGGGKS